jgi:excisionase family DNA binding protein
MKQAAQFWGVNEKTIRRRIADGTLLAYRVGPRAIRVDRDSLLKLARPVVAA